MPDPSTPAPDIRWRPGTRIPRIPQGPSFWPRLRSGELFRENAATFLLTNAQRYGDLVFYRALGRQVFQFNHPDLIQQLLVNDAPSHHRNLVMQRGRAVLGNGLLTSEEPLHMRQRRLAAPAFHRQRIAAYGEVIASYTARMSAQWSSGATLDLRPEMLLLALRIVGKTLFDTDVDSEVESISAAVDSFQGFLPIAFLPFPELIQRLPIPAMRNIRKGRVQLDTLIYHMIAERRADPTDRGDLLSMLLSSEDQASEDEEARMTDTQVRDECLTILLAGHETTANALTFALWLLAHHPEEQDLLAEETRATLQGRTPTAADYPNLPRAERIFAEALRLYPPVWVTARTAAQPYELNGLPIPKGAILVAPQYAVHRDPRFWPDPNRFNPARFTPEAKITRPKFAYFPFGAGGRQCIGEGLAWMEGVLALATMAQHWRFTPPASGPGAGNTIPIAPSVSLRPKGAVPLTVTRRN